MTGRAGFALVVSVLLIAILGIAAAGVLALGARELEIARAMARRAEARAAAEGGVRRSLGEWSSRRYRELAVGSVLSEGDNADRVDVTRLAHDLFLVRATAGRPGGVAPVTARAGGLVRTLDPDSLASAFPAPLSAGAAARVSGGTVANRDLGCATAGPGTPEPAPAILAPAVEVGPGATVTGEPAVLLADPPAHPRDALLRPPAIHHLRPTIVTAGAVTPRPESRAGVCQPGPGNWGGRAPSDPCHDHLPLLYAPGDLTVRGGEGRGLLVVDGDLHLVGHRFDGVILVRGRVSIAASAVVRGAVRGWEAEMGGGDLIFSPCHVRAALTAGGLDGPFRHPARLWVPAF
jgi:hypothetical protein